jgi:60 kDa SS-A/Ro ribonucleoprotein
VSKFNQTQKVTFDTVNLAGGPAYGLSTKAALVSLLLTSFLKDQYYRSGDETLVELQKLVASVPPEFAAKAALFARDEFGMRSVSHVVAGELARHVKGEKWLRRFYKRIVVRPDDVTEILSYWMTQYGKPIPNAMKRGLGDAMSEFDAYGLSKYKAEGKALAMVDVVNLCHPKHSLPLAQLVNGQLAPPETWEVGLTQAGSDPEAKRAVWTKLLREKKLGYFALLRNLRNIAAQAPEVLPMVYEQLTNAETIGKSRVLPFRYLSAWDALADTQPPMDLLRALSQATDIAVANMPRFEGKTLIAVDGSGSMTGGWNWSTGKPTMAPIRIAALFASALLRTNDADVMLFDTRVQWPHLNPMDSVVTNAESIERQAHAGGTDFHLIFGEAKKPYDRVFILSDMAAWHDNSLGGYSPEGAWKSYKKRCNADPWVYCLDLQGYGTTQYPASKVVQLYGWSEKVFDYVKLAERGSDAIVEAVERIEL